MEDGPASLMAWISNVPCWLCDRPADADLKHAMIKGD